MKYLEDEPFMLRRRPAKEIAEYEAGLRAGSNGEEVDETQSLAWQRGWAEAQE